MVDKNISQEESVSKLSKAQERIRDLEVQIDALKLAKEKYRQIVENANSIILVMDVNGDITFFNKFAQRFFGFYESDILGKNVIGTIVSEKDLSGKGLVDIIRDIIENPERHSLNENENIRANGERVRILWTNKAMISDDGTIDGILCIGNQVVRLTS
jgi:PAS domain S-box-containing protein